MNRLSIAAFLADEDGAITIDWVSLTAGILLLGIAVIYAIFSSGVEPLVNSINGSLRSAGLGITLPETPFSPDEASGGGGDTTLAANDYTFGWTGTHAFTQTSTGSGPVVGNITYTDGNNQSQTLHDVTSNAMGGGLFHYTNGDNQVVAVEHHTGPDSSASAYSMTIVGEPFDYVPPAT